MKLPIIISTILALIAFIGIFLVSKQTFDLVNRITIVVYIVTALGGLVSAVFIIYGYFVNLEVFKESQKPKILLQVVNQRANLMETGENVHITVVHYMNLSSNECRGLSLKLSLIKDNEIIEIPRLFQKEINIGPNDRRTRDFPTLVYLKNNGIPNSVADNLEKYRLRAAYSYSIMGEKINSYYDYEWDKSNQQWGIV